MDLPRAHHRMRHRPRALRCAVGLAQAAADVERYKTECKEAGIEIDVPKSSEKKRPKKEPKCACRRTTAPESRTPHPNLVEAERVSWHQYEGLARRLGNIR